MRLARTKGDALLAGGLAVLYVLEAIAAGQNLWRGPGAPWLAALASLVFIVSLAWRRRLPLVVFALAFIPMALAWTGPQQAPNAFTFGLLVAVYSVGAHTGGPSAVVGALGVAAVFALAVLEDPAAVESYGDLGFLLLVIGGPWFAGVAIRLRREQEHRLERRAVHLEHDRDEQIREATTAERARIARDLHDVVAHSISIMLIQARGGRHALASDPAGARAALDAIEAVGSQALTEMQRMLELLHDGEPGAPSLAPQPSLRHVEALADEVSRAGMPVAVSVEGERSELPPGIDVSAYRIVQEALTNALKHAGPATAQVAIRFASDSLDLEIVDTGGGVVRSDPGGTDAGHGLTGMQERARLYRGIVEAGPRPEGGFAVRAHFPLGEESR